MVHPTLFALFFASLSAGLSIALLAGGDATRIAGPLERLLQAGDPAPPLAAACVACSEVPDLDPSPPPSLAAADPAPVQGAVAAPPAAAAPAAADPAAARVIAFFAKRHSGLATDELKRVARAIASEAARHNLDVELVLAVIRIESGGYNFAVSKVGALGLMQIMPATGRELAENEGVEWRGTETLFDPIVNVRLGVRYLQHLAERYDGHIPTALAAYNWGPGRIDGFLRRGSRIPARYSSAVLEAYAKLGAPTRSS